MNKSEAGKLGWEKTKHLHEERYNRRIKKYELSPTLCTTCKEPIEYKKRKNNFCSRSCFVTYNNKRRAKQPALIKCNGCNKDIIKKNSKTKYCSGKCQQEFYQKEYIKKWKNGEVNGIIGKYFLSKRIRKYLFEKYNNVCCKCGWGELNSYTNTIPLEVSHIDGNFRNNREENLELICPNCHSLEATAKGANKGNGRKERQKYWENMKDL